jgi:serine/threonine protein kinase
MAEQGPLSGQILGEKYLVGEMLGEGGFGMVYTGRHLLLDRSQAIKLLQERYFRRPRFRERFLREARMVAALDHPHIVHIDDFGMEEQTSRAYLVMSFINGGTFYTILKEQHKLLAMEQVLSYIEQIGSALEYAHRRGVVHLDLKPQNLLIHEDGRLLLADFGLAHLLKQEEIEGGTSLGYGTPHYMAPEHIRGQPEKQSDIYALGVILYQMLAGRRPFEGSTPEAVMTKHLTEPPPPLQTLRPELPLEMVMVVEKALAKQVAERYQSAGELVLAFKDAVVHAQELAHKAEEEQTRKAREEQTTLLLPHPASTGILQGPRQRPLSWKKAGLLLLVLVLLVLGSAGGRFAIVHISTARTQATATAKAQVRATAQVRAAPQTSVNSNQLPTPASYKKINNTDLNVLLEYPDNWDPDQIKTTSTTAYLDLHPHQPLNMIFYIIHLTDTVSSQFQNASDINTAQIQSLQSQQGVSNFQMVQSPNPHPIIGGAKWTAQEETFQASGDIYHLTVISTQHGKSYYTLLFWIPKIYYAEAMEKYIQPMLQSVQFIK